MITLSHLRQAISIASSGGTADHPYKQNQWGDNECGTPCCVAGFARLAAGQPIVNQSLKACDVVNHPAARRIVSLMGKTSPDILHVMRAVTDDGHIHLQKTNLSRLDLSGADLRGADLSWADLSGADLRGADLRGADWSWADLRGADLRGADLRGADLSLANAEWAKF